MVVPSDLDLVRETYHRALDLHVRRRPAAAARLYKSVLRVLGDSVVDDVSAHQEAAYVRVRSLIGLANCALEMQSDTEDGLRLLAQAEEAAGASGDDRLVGAVCGQRGLLLLRSGRTTAAMREFDRALSAGLEPRDAMVVRINRGVLYLERREHAVAVEDFQEAVFVAERIGDDLRQAMAGHNLGYTRYLQGDIPAALSEMDRVAGLLPPSAQSVCLLDKAQVLYDAGLLRDAESALARAVDLLTESRMVRDLAEVELVRARVALELRRHGEAERAARSARRRFRRMGSQAWVARADLAIVQAQLAARRSEVSPSRRVLDRIARDAATLADQATALGQHEARTVEVPARLLAVSALLAAGRDDEGAAVLETVRRPSTLSPLPERIQHETVSAEVAFRRGDRRAGLRASRRGLALLASHRARLGAIEAVTAAAVHGVRLVWVDVDAALRTGRPDAIFDALERGRATFAGAGRVRPPEDPVAADLLTQARALLAQARQIPPDAGAEALATRDDLLARARRLQDQVRERAWRDAGEARVPTPTTHREVRARLAAHASAQDAGAEATGRAFTVANFFIVRGRIAVVVVTSARSRVLDVADAAEVEDRVRRVRADLAVCANELIPPVMRTAARASLDRSLAWLDAALVAPLRADGPLYVAARDTLLALPWQSLPSRRGRRTIVNSRVALVPDGRLGQDRTRAAVLAGPGLLHAEAEATAVAEVWPGADVRLGEEATTRATREALAGSDIVHLAAHGTHEADNPLFSSLRLADGPLFAYELDGTSIPGAVVVLSACEVGGATSGIGGEALGLTSVLLRLGARAVIAAVAPLRDDVAARVMPALHVALRDGAAPGEALARAVADEDEPVPLVCFGPLAV